MKPTELKSTRDGIGDGLVDAGKITPNLVVLTGDLTESVRSDSFKKVYPDRFIQMGIAEQNMMGVAAGLALSGKIPVVTSYAIFSPGGNWEQLRLAVCYQNLNVKIFSSHAGLSVGPDGATHQALEDIALTRVLPNLTVLTPCDYDEAKAMVKEAIKHVGPVYIRHYRLKSLPIPRETAFAGIGEAQVIKIGDDVTIVACGPVIGEALKAADLLEKDKISAEIINCSSIKPLDTDTILRSVKNTNCLVTVEDHQQAGGMGSAILEALATSYAAPLTEMVAVKDKFGESGEPEQLWHKYGLDSEAIVKAVKKVLSRKRRL